MLSLLELKKAGFTKSGAFTLLDGIVTLTISEQIPDHPGIYLLVVRGKVRYVGKADRSLHHRLTTNERGLRNGSAKRKVHSGILEAINCGKSVAVYILTITKGRFFKRNGLTIDYLVGLEAGLIENLVDPHWNPFNSAGRARRAKPPFNP
jgi:hypothetical protein